MSESNIKIMSPVYACRACLETSLKLYNMHKYNLIKPYEILTNTQITSNDGLPHQLCSFCVTLMLKCNTFRERCRVSQQLLNYAVLERNPITTDYISKIDRQTHNLTLPYTIEHNTIIKEEHSTEDESNSPSDDREDNYKNLIKYEESSNDIEDNDDNHIKYEESSNDIEDNDDNHIKYEENNSTSDEEPLSKKIVKIPNKKRRRKRKSEKKYTDLKIKNEIQENDEFDDNIDDNFDSNKQNLDCFETNDEIDVVILTKEQQVEEVQMRKKSLNYLHSFFKCDKCYKGFMTEGTFKNHMARHDPASGAHACEVCATRWPCARTLRAHALASHERMYVCKRCNHVSKSSHRAKEHSKWHDGFVYVCDICGATFSKSTSHLTHIRLRHPSEHACELCGQAFIGRYGLNMHKKKAHRGAEGDKSQCELQCVVCGVQFRSVEALGAHVAASGDNTCDPGLKSCVFCGLNCNDEVSLREHMREHGQRQRGVSCAECGRKFANSRTYSVHYQHFHLGGGAPRGRSACRSPAESVVCEVCGKKCMSKATLVYHQRTHTGEKPYQCPECPKRFSIHQRLQIHLRTHTGERPFKCSHCPKAFKQKAALNRHDRVHSGAKPYACAHCGKTFSQSNSMKMHVRTVHLKLPAPYRHNRKPKLE